MSVTLYVDQLGDELLLQGATELGRVLFTQDRDFLAIAHAWLDSGRDFAGVIYAHQLQVTIGQAVRDLELIARLLDPSEIRRRVMFLPL